jgi:hypothetical protein
MFLRGCSWDGGRDLVGPRGHARHPSWQRRQRRAAAADSTSALEKDAGSAEWQDWRVSKLQQQKQELMEDTRESPSPCQNRRFSLIPADPNGLDSTLKFDFWVRSLQSPTRLGRLGLGQPVEPCKLIFVTSSDPKASFGFLGRTGGDALRASPPVTSGNECVKKNYPPKRDH